MSILEIIERATFKIDVMVQPILKRKNLDMQMKE